MENGREKYPSMRTMFTDSKWLDGAFCVKRFSASTHQGDVSEPHFVQSFDIGSYVYFFFREAAVEFENCGRATYSRVARICKVPTRSLILLLLTRLCPFFQNDLGGKNVLRQVWATYLKARLNCSLPGEFPFYFDQLRMHTLPILSASTVFDQTL